jgi:hypothetical protein
MFKKMFQKLKEGSSLAAFITFGLFVLALSIVLFVFNLKVPVNLEKNSDAIKHVVLNEHQGDTLINFDIKKHTTWMIDSKQYDVIPVVYDVVCDNDTVTYVSYVETLPRLFYWEIGNVVKKNELPARW